MYLFLAKSEVNKDFIFSLFLHSSCVLEAVIDC
jgi:hypothetical protein